MSALAAAERVKKYARAVPLQPHEQPRAPHPAPGLRDETEVRSESVGEGPIRQVVVVPADMKDAAGAVIRPPRPRPDGPSGCPQAAIAAFGGPRPSRRAAAESVDHVARRTTRDARSRAALVSTKRLNACSFATPSPRSPRRRARRNRHRAALRRRRARDRRSHSALPARA